MSVTFDATVGGGSTNTYVSLEDADDYFAKRTGSGPWDSANTETRQKALMDVARRMDRIRWTGEKTSEAQALEWPRAGVYLFDALVLENAIPDRVQDAACELALWLLSGGDSPLEGVQSFSVGGLSMSLSGVDPGGAFPPAVDRLIAPFRSCPGSVVLRRG